MPNPPQTPCKPPAAGSNGVVKLLASALAVGVQVSIQGDAIKVKGPASAKALAQLLVERKADVLSAFGEWTDEAAAELMCATDAEFEKLGASGSLPIVARAAEVVSKAYLARDTNALIGSCYEVLRLARAQVNPNTKAA